MDKEIEKLFDELKDKALYSHNYVYDVKLANQVIRAYFEENIIDYHEKALDIVSEAFKGKKDKGGNDYIWHLKAVSDKFINKDYKTVALLHDLLEDCSEWNINRLRLEFPKHICDCVVILTKIKWETYSEYIERVKKDRICIEVKIADLEHNMDLTRLKEITDKDLKRMAKYHETWLELKEYLVKTCF